MDCGGFYYYKRNKKCIDSRKRNSNFNIFDYWGNIGDKQLIQIKG